MARHLLTNLSVKAASEPGRYLDGAGLYLIVDRHGKRWVLFYRWRNKRREMGLGPYPAISLASAREKAEEARQAVLAGVDPIEARKAPVAAPETFASFAEDLIADLKSGWTGAKTEAGWRRSLLTHAKGLATKPLDAITTADVLETVKPYWTNQPESGQKLRARIEVTLDAAKARGLRSGDNPARWRGHMDRLLSKPRKLVRGHHRSLHYSEAPDLMKRLAEKPGMSARALEWTILNAARENMTLGAMWPEIRDDWHVPADRMKRRLPFVVPLTPQAKAVLTKCDRSTPFVFPGARLEKGLSNAAMDKLLKDMGVDATPHGFRTTFREWAGDKTGHAEEVAEAALDHVHGSSTRRSYRRSVDLELRRALMQDWADYLTSPALPDKQLGTSASE